MADAVDSKSIGATHVGSSPTFGTNTPLASRGGSHESDWHRSERGDTVTAPSSEDVTFGGWRACDVCGEPIATIEEGALVLRTSNLDERRAAVAALDAAASEPTGLAPWDWGHGSCFGALNPFYVIDGPRMDTLPRMMARTLQLLDKDWFLETAWEDAVRRFYRVPFE